MRKYIIDSMRCSPHKIYVASSWRNVYQPGVVDILRHLGHEVYDFRNPEGRTGFSWSDVDPDWQQWDTRQYRDALHNPISEAGFQSDYAGMCWADICVLVLPCGRSAHVEAGVMKGLGKPVFVYSPEKQEPELMYKLFDFLIADEQELRRFFFCTDNDTVLKI